MTKFYVYKITNLSNGKIYIGKSIDPDKRWARHVYTAKTNKSGYKQLLLHRAIKKYGKENFNVEVLSEYDYEQEALNGERSFIKQYQSNNLEIGYNLTEGGEGIAGYKLTQEQKDAISIRNSGENNGMYGHKQSLEERKERSRKVSETKSRKDNSNKAFSSETIEKLKIAVREKSSQKLSNEQKDEMITLYNTGNFLKRDLALKYSVEEKTITYVLRYWEKVKNNKSKYLTQEQKEQITNMYLSKKYTKQQISDSLQISFNRVIAAIRVYQNNINRS